ncbi:MAG: CBS domain-containing protein, partial [Rhodospirillales bacterium]
MPRSTDIRCLALKLNQLGACSARCGTHVEQGRPVMRIVDVMTRNPQPVSPDATLQDAARLMDDLNVGALPVC